MQTLRSLSFALGILVIALIAASCTTPVTQPTSALPTAASPANPTSAAASSTPQRGGILTVGMRAEPFQLDPIKDLGSDGNDVILTSQMIESLIGVDQEGKMVPQLAEAMPEVSADGLTYTFKLRQGIKFHDGTDFDAEAVKFNWQNLIDPAYGSRQTGRIAPLVKSIEVVDPYTVRVTFNKVYPDFMAEVAYRTWWRINSPTAVKKLGKDYGSVTGGVVGTGPFKFKEWNAGDSIVLERNENYWDKDVPYLDGITYKVFKDPSVAVLNLKTNNLDFLFNLPFQFLKEVQSLPNVKVMSHGSGINELIFLNTTLPMFNDKRVRQALNLAIDRQAINDVLFSGLAEIPNGPFPSWHWAYAKDVPPPAYDPDKARSLLAEAGYGESNPLKFELRTWTDPKLVDQASLVKGMWEKVGVQVEILPLDKAAFYDPILGKKDPAKYSKFQAGLSDFSGGFPDTASYAQYEYASGGSLNTTSYNEPGGYQNPEAQKLIEEADGTSDQEKAAAAYAKLAAILQEDVPQISILWLPNMNAVNTRVNGFQIASQNFIPFKNIWLSNP